MTASMRAVTETTLFLDNFTNVDLYFQGYYCLRTRLYYEVEQANARVYATPLSLQYTNDLELRAKNTDQRTMQHRSNLAGRTKPTLANGRPITSLAREITNQAVVPHGDDDVDDLAFSGGSFAKANQTLQNIFKNNLSKYNENASQLLSKQNVPQQAAKNQFKKKDYPSDESS